MSNNQHNPDGSSGHMLEAELVLQEAFNIDDIECDEGLQARAQLDQETIDSYAEEMQRNVQFPPIEIFYDDTHYYLADGWHRFKAAMKIDARVIQANVRRGTRREAILYAAGANITHGLRRSNADKRKAVTLLLSDEECRQWSNHKVAEHASVDHKTVGCIRKELETSGKIPQIEKRIVERSGQTFRMGTTKESKKPEISQEASASDNEALSQESNTQAVEDDALAETLGHSEAQDKATPALQETSSDQPGSDTSERAQSPSAAETPLASAANETDVEQVERPEVADFTRRLMAVMQEYVQQHPAMTATDVQEAVEEALRAIHQWMSQPQATVQTTNA